MTKKIFLFGDSICFGQLISGHKTWAAAFARLLEARNTKNIDFLVQNAGVNGNTTRQALERLYYEVLTHKPDYVLIQFGMNDCNYWETDAGLPRVSREAFKANLIEILDKCKLSGVKHCFLSTNHPSNKGAFSHTTEVTYDESNSIYNHIIRNLYNEICSDAASITLLDNERIWRAHLSENTDASLDDLLLEDGVHLSDHGHRLYEKTTVNNMLQKICLMENL